jgi:hypothetical protein
MEIVFTLICHRSYSLNLIVTNFSHFWHSLYWNPISMFILEWLLETSLKSQSSQPISCHLSVDFDLLSYRQVTRGPSPSHLFQLQLKYTKIKKYIIIKAILRICSGWIIFLLTMRTLLREGANGIKPNGECNNLLLLIPSLPSNGSSSVDVVTMEITICDYYAFASK